MSVVVIWFCCSSWLAFLVLAYLINLIHHVLVHWVICFGSYLFFHTPFFLEKYLNFCGFLSVPHFVDNYAKIKDEALSPIAHYRASFLGYDFASNDYDFELPRFLFLFYLLNTFIWANLFNICSINFSLLKA